MAQITIFFPSRFCGLAVRFHYWFCWSLFVRLQSGGGTTGLEGPIWLISHAGLLVLPVDRGTHFSAWPLILHKLDQLPSVPGQSSIPRGQKEKPRSLLNSGLCGSHNITSVTFYLLVKARHESAHS